MMYPGCPDCGGVLTPRVPDSPHQWRDGAELAAGVVCDCGYASNHPPICLRRNGRLYVRVPDTLLNTGQGRRLAIQRVPNTWRRGSFAYQWLEEVRAGSYRWWVFSQGAL